MKINYFLLWHQRVNVLRQICCVLLAVRNVVSRSAVHGSTDCYAHVAQVAYLQANA